MNRNVIIYFLGSILLISLFIESIIQTLREGISTQNGSVVANALGGVTDQINATNDLLKNMFQLIEKLPLTNKQTYSSIINTQDQPLVKLQNLMNVIQTNLMGMGPMKSDAAVVNALITNDPAYDSATKTNTAISQAFTMIVSFKIEDNKYLNVINKTSPAMVNDPKTYPISKYMELVDLVNKKTNFSD
jgi:hypothetical protein